VTATFVVYIDESGDEGFLFEKGSSRWFILSGVVTRKTNDLETVKLIDEVRAQLKHPDLVPLHFRKLKHEHRLPLVSRIAKADLKIVSVLVNKPMIVETEKFRQRNVLYFYAVRYLLERVSWYCRDHKTSHDSGDGTADVIFSNRGGMSYVEMKAYLEKLKGQTSLFDVRVDWSIIKSEQITAFAHEKRMGLQIADAAASSFYYAVERSSHGFTEDRYIRILKPVVYQNKGQYKGYGLKFWPRDTESKIETDEEFEWMRNHYTQNL
jgi:hypothetical protein